MVVEIIPAIQGFRGILDGLKALRDIRDETKRNEATIELSRQIIDLQAQMMSALEEKAALTKRIQTLESEIVQLRTKETDFSRFELKAVGNGGSAYMLKPEFRGDEPPHWLCPNCFSSGKKSIFQFSSRMPSMGDIYRCSTCKAHMTVNGTPQWIGVTQPMTDTRDTCRFCRIGKLDLIDSKPDRLFGDLGVQLETLKCNNPACGRTAERQFDTMQKR